MSASSPVEPRGHDRARPLRIGVSACFFHPEDRPVFKHKRLLYVEESMVHWVASAGALPVMVPTLPAGGPLTVADLVADLDGLLLHGGADVCPRTYGQEPVRAEWEGDAVRDRYEIALVEACLAADTPILGICRGLQLLNVALGGTLWQDLPTQIDTPTVHRDQQTYDRNVHEVAILPGTVLGAAYGLGRPGVDDEAPLVEVSSVHHQAIREPADDLVVEAVSPTDGVIEAVRLDRSDRWVLGVQWHPEFSDPDLTPDLLDRRPLMTAFLDAARSRT